MSFSNDIEQINQESDSASDNGTSVDPVEIYETNSNNLQDVVRMNETGRHDETDSGNRLNAANEASSSLQQNFTDDVDNGEEELEHQQRIMQIRFANRGGNVGIFRRSLRQTLQTFTGESKETASTDIEELNFDRNLPTSHSYLGELEECHGVAYQEDNILLQLPILLLHDFILVPGQTLPLQLLHLSEIAMIKRVMNNSEKLFGILSYTRESMLEQKSVCEIGCTAEIRSIKEREDYQVPVMAVVVQGRQRFKIINKRTQIDGNMLPTVHILSDVDLPELHKNVITNHHHRASSSTTKCSMYEKFKKRYRLTQHAAMSTRWDPWIYRMYDMDYLRMLIFCELREWNPDLKENQVPIDHSEFSFWVIKTLPISHAWRLYLVSLNSAVQRMRCQLHLLSQRNVIACKSCGSHIAKRSDSFSMSASGPMAAYVNPGGVIHETLTVLKVQCVDYVGNKTTENSWFPGYAWTILQCADCFEHLGWRFTSTKSKLRPKKFWGLTRSSVHPINPDDTDHDVIQPRL